MALSRNVEIKARVDDGAGQRVRDAAKALSGSDGDVLTQRDVFFAVKQGRLKLRRVRSEKEAGDRAQLIFYQRPDSEGPKTSEYRLSAVSHPDEMEETLAAALGVVGEVRKTRALYLVDQTRIHCDHVDGLGEFLELEVVLRAGQDEAEGQEIARAIMRQLGVKEENLIAGAYMDLLLAN